MEVHLFEPLALYDLPLCSRAHQERQLPHLRSPIWTSRKEVRWGRASGSRATKKDEEKIRKGLRRASKSSFALRSLARSCSVHPWDPGALQGATKATRFMRRTCTALHHISSGLLAPECPPPSPPPLKYGYDMLRHATATSIKRPLTLDFEALDGPHGVESGPKLLFADAHEVAQIIHDMPLLRTKRSAPKGL